MDCRPDGEQLAAVASRKRAQLGARGLQNDSAHHSCADVNSTSEAAKVDGSNIGAR